MFEISTSHPLLSRLFDPATPDYPVLSAVLLGRHTGRVVADNLQHPSQCVLRTDATLTFASRWVSRRFLQASLDYFRLAGDIWLVWPPSPAALLELPDAPKTIHRYEFLDCDANSQILIDFRQSLPREFAIQSIDRLLLERCEWRSDIEFFCGSVDNFLANDIGLCMLCGDEIIVEAYVSSFGEHQAEIGAVTHEKYRGRGYAPIACAYLIQECEQRGCQVVWSCDVDNQASIRVAQKLGFQRQRTYQTLEYPAT